MASKISNTAAYEIAVTSLRGYSQNYEFPADAAERIAEAMIIADFNKDNVIDAAMNTIHDLGVPRK